LCAIKVFVIEFDFLVHQIEQSHLLFIQFLDDSDLIQTLLWIAIRSRREIVGHTSLQPYRLRPEISGLIPRAVSSARRIAATLLRRLEQGRALEGDQNRFSSRSSNFGPLLRRCDDQTANLAPDSVGARH
jgi:hypothetical protein